MRFVKLATLVSIGLAWACTPSPSTEPSSPQEPAPPPLACAQDLPGAIYCQPTEAGKPINGAISIHGVGGVTVRHDGDRRLQSFDVKARVLRPMAFEPAAEIVLPRDVLFRGDAYCFPAAGGYRCAPIAGGPTVPWIAGAIRVERLGQDRFAAIVEGEGGVFDVVVADARGKPGPSLGRTRSAWLDVVGADTIVYESENPSEGVRAVAAAGGTPRDLGVWLFETSQVYVRGRSIVEAHHLQPGERVDVDTLERDKLPALPPAATVTRAGAATLLLIDYRSVQVLGTDGRPAETLFELPMSSAQPAPMLTSWAVTDDALFVLVLNTPCLQGVYGTRGGGPGYQECADRPGFWAIVRVPLPLPA